MAEKGTLYFFTGLAGAGKSTIGGLFYERLRARKPDAVLKDGHRLREKAVQSGVPRDYSNAARRAGARGTMAECRRLTDEGLDVVLCSMSLFADVRAWCRENIGNYREIYLRVGMDTLRTRREELYSGRQKQVVGLDLSWDEPTTPDVVIDNEGTETPEEIVDRLVKQFGLE